jgi:sorbose reductase
MSICTTIFSSNTWVTVTGGTGTLALTAARALLEHGVTGLALWDISPDDALPVIGQLHASCTYFQLVAVP